MFERCISGFWGSPHAERKKAFIQTAYSNTVARMPSLLEPGIGPSDFLKLKPAL